MAPMKAMKAAAPAMSKGALAQAIADQCEQKKTQITKVLDSLASVGASQVARKKTTMKAKSENTNSNNDKTNSIDNKEGKPHVEKKDDDAINTTYISRSSIDSSSTWRTHS